MNHEACWAQSQWSNAEDFEPKASEVPLSLPQKGSLLNTLVALSYFPHFQNLPEAWNLESERRDEIFSIQWF